MSSVCVKNGDLQVEFAEEEAREMGVLSHRVKRDKVKAGDHIYTRRSAFTYSHHGIYIGKDKVVHFTPDPTQNLCSLTPCSCSVLFPDSSPASSSKEVTYIVPTNSLCAAYPTKESCMFSDCAWRQGTGGVVVSCLDCFIGSGSLYLFDYGVSWYVFLTKLRGGTCTTCKSDPPEDSVKRAEFLLGKVLFGQYNVLRNNCEDFALYCKTGLVVRSRTGGSGQVTQAFTGASYLARTSLISVGLYAVLGPCSASAFTGVASVEGISYIRRRYYNDMGVRADVRKVQLQDFPLAKGSSDHKKSSKSIPIPDFISISEDIPNEP